MALSSKVLSMCYDVEFKLGVVQEYLDDSSEELLTIEKAIDQLKTELGSLEVEYASLYDRTETV